MCLKEYHIFTFTNREALDRLVRELPHKYGDKTIKGLLHKVILFHLNMENTWNTLTFDELMTMRLTRHWFDIKSFNLRNWEQYNEVLSKLGDCQFVFGKIEVEIR